MARLHKRDAPSASLASVALLHWMLRVSCAMTFIGHGAWGVIGKQGWLPFYALFWIPEPWAWKSMPLIGAIDIALGIAVLIRPCRAMLAYMAFWTVFTALLRPAVGQGWWEFLERAGNYGPPIAFYVIATAQNLDWFERILPHTLSSDVLKRVAWGLRVSIALLLIGHGGLALVQQKKILLDHVSTVHDSAGPSTLRVVGAAEMLAGTAALATTSPAILLGIATWKIATEFLHPIAGRLVDTWEWVERGGDYVAPVALLIVLTLLHQSARIRLVRPGVVDTSDRR